MSEQPCQVCGETILTVEVAKRLQTAAKQRQVHVVTRDNPLFPDWGVFRCAECGAVWWEGKSTTPSIGKVLARAKLDHNVVAHGWQPTEEAQRDVAGA